MVSTGRRNALKLGVATAAITATTVLPNPAEAATDGQLQDYLAWLGAEMNLVSWALDDAGIPRTPFNHAVHEWMMAEYGAKRSPRGRALAQLRAIGLAG